MFDENRKFGMNCDLQIALQSTLWLLMLLVSKLLMFTLVLAI